MSPRSGSRGVFALSLGLAASLHGAALAYALSWHRPAEVEPKVEEPITVEIVDAAMVEDERAPEPPADKLPSAAAKAAETVAENEAPERQQLSSAPADKPVELASAAPELGEPRRETVVEPLGNSEPAAAEAMPVRNEPSAMLPAPPPEIETPVEAATPAPALSEPAPANPPPAAMDVATEADPPPDADARIAMMAPADDAPRVVVVPPVTASGSADETRPDAVRQSLMPSRMRKALRPLRSAALTARPLPEDALDALKPKPKVEPKRVAKRESDESKAKKALVKTVGTPKAKAAAKKQSAKAKRMAALAVEGEASDAGAPKAAKTKLKGKNKAVAKTGKGVFGATTSGSAGIGTYWNSVGAKIRRNRGQNSSGRRGKVIIAIGVTRSGGLQFARISKSSGFAALDQAALAAVRRSAPFPPPPPGASAALLLKGVPIEFR